MSKSAYGGVEGPPAAGGDDRSQQRGEATIRVAIADDSPLIRQGVEALLGREPDIAVVAVCEDGKQLEHAVAGESPDAVVLDIRMPPSGALEGLRLARLMRERRPAMGVVLLSQHVEPEYALELMQGGSSRRAYLLKDNLRDGAELAAAIRAVAAGGSVVDPQVVDALVQGRGREQPSPLQALTDRERQVLAQMAEGKTNSAIATSLVLTRRAVEKHVNAIFSKLDLGDPEDVSRRVKAALVFLAAAPDRDR
jgi:DNA-binding NarL/FixJ family response regulator